MMQNTQHKIKRALKILSFIFCIFLFLSFYGFSDKEYIAATSLPQNKNPGNISSNENISADENNPSNDHLKLPHDTLKVAWDNWFPYDYLKVKNLQSSLTGLDAELIKFLAKSEKQPIKFEFLPWDDTMNALRDGKIDMASGTSYSKERAEFAYFSKPYRTEEDSLYVLRAKDKNYSFETVDEFLSYIQNNRFILGVIQNDIYADIEVNNFITNKLNSNRIVLLKNPAEGFEKLKNNEIDGFIADRIIGSTYIWEERLDNEIVEHYIKMKTEIYFVFSKKTVSKEMVEEFNHAIDHYHDTQRYKRIFSWYLYPIIMVQTTGQHWFMFLDILGTIFFSISGVLIAYSLNGTLLAAFMYAFLPSIAGVMIRDVIFNHRPIEALSNPEYMYLVCSTVLLGYLLMFFYEKFRHSRFMQNPSFNIKKGIDILNFNMKQILVICDALGLAALTVSGVMISLMAKVEPLWLWGPFFAFISAAAGTIIRDIISKNEFLEIVVGEIYSEIAVFWGLFLSVTLVASSNNITPELVRNLVVITVIGAFTTRLLVYYFKVPNVFFR